MQEKLWTKQYITALIILFGICMGSNIVLSVLPIFAKNLTGLDTYAGMMTSLFTLFALSVRFVSGKIVENIGCKKVMFGGLLLTLLSTFLYINCNQIYLALLYRAIQGVGFGISQTAVSTYITKLCPPSRLMEGVNFSAVANSVTSVLGPAISFLLIGEKYNRFSFLFIVTFGIAVLTAILILCSQDIKIVKEKGAQEDKQAKIQWIRLLLPSTILFLACLSQSAITSFISLYAISLGFAGVGSFFSINAIGMIGSRFIMSKLVNRYGAFSMILINCAIFGGSLFLLANVRVSWQLLFLALPAGFSMGSVAPIVNVFMIQQMPGSKSGIANSLYYSAMDIGYAIGSLLWGVLASTLGYPSLFFIAAIVQIICVLLSILQIHRFKIS